MNPVLSVAGPWVWYACAHSMAPGSRHMGTPFWNMQVHSLVPFFRVSILSFCIRHDLRRCGLHYSLHVSIVAGWFLVALLGMSQRTEPDDRTGGSENYAHDISPLD